MRFAAAQFDIVWEDKPANHAKIEAMLREADVQPGTFILLPELGDTGFSMNLDRIADDRSLKWASGLAQNFSSFVQHGFATISSEIGDGSRPRGRNCAVVI